MDTQPLTDRAFGGHLSWTSGLLAQWIRRPSAWLNVINESETQNSKTDYYYYDDFRGRRLIWLTVIFAQV